MGITYATFVAESSYTRTNGNLTVEKTSDDSTWDNIRLDIEKSTGKVYFEIYVDNSGSGYIMIGVVASSTPTTNYVGYYTNSFSYYGLNGTKITNATQLAYGNTFTTGDTIGVAIDFGIGKIWFSKNGVWQGSGDPETGTGFAYDTLSGGYIPAVSAYYTATKATLRSNPADLVYLAPVGFESGF